MAEIIERVKGERRAIRTQTTKLLHKLEGLLTETELDAEAVETILNQLAAKEPRLAELDRTIRDSIADINELETETIRAEEYQEKIIACISLANIKMKRKTWGQQQQQQENERDRQKPHSSKITVKLPKLTLEKFYGDSCDWQGFWSRFDASIHSNSELAETDKFSYLKSYVGGIAANAISGLPLTGDNYDAAIQILTDRFGRSDIVINSHMNKLLNLTPVRKATDIRALRSLYDSCEIQIRSLESVGVISDSYGSLLCPILIKLIPEEIALEYSRRRKLDKQWDVLDLLEFLREEVESRERANLLIRTSETESADRKQTSFKSYAKQPSAPHKPQMKHNTPSAASLATNTTEYSCVFCEKNHYPNDCKEISVAEKKNKLKKKGRCFICLKRGHLARFCRSRKNPCLFCGNWHHSSICDSLAATTEFSGSKPEEDAVINYQSQNGQSVILQTVRAQAEGVNGSETIRCLLDGGSQRTFIREDLARRLRLPVTGEENLTIHTFGSSTPLHVKRKRVKVTLRNIRNPHSFIELEALMTPTISSLSVIVPSNNLMQRALSKGIDLSDQVQNDERKISELDMLIGSDYYWKIMKTEIERVGEALVAMKTLFGWTLQGPIPSTTLSIGTTQLFMNKVLIEESDIISDKQLRTFWELEHLGITDMPLSKSDDEAVLHLETNLVKKNGRYEVALPWKSERPELHDNFRLAKNRLDSLARRFNKDVLFYDLYSSIIKEHLRRGIIEEVIDDNEDYEKTVHYLPHHAVSKQDRETTKLRIVFDASSHEEGCASLNDCLMPGPNMNPNLLSVLLKFRIHKIALTADIEKAFLQISIANGDRDAVRILWFDESPLGKRSPNFKILRLTRVLFGCTSSPFLLTGTIRKHLDQFKDTDPEICELLINCLYVDDFISGADDETEASKIRDRTTCMLADAGMNLCKWRSNFSVLELEQDVNNICNESTSFKEKTRPDQHKVLGLIWDRKDDSFLFDLQSLKYFLIEKRDTKRSVLQATARIYDPIGFLSPFTIRMKCLFQELWERGLEWDQDLPEDLQTKWRQWCSELPIIQEIRIPRCYCMWQEVKPSNLELHVFSDASQKAYGATVYVRFRKETGEFCCTLVCSKARVAPLKKLSLPRLELMGAVLAARLLNFTKDSFKEVQKIQLWTDSTIVEHWIKGDANRWKPFVSNRVREIQNLTEPNAWQHCPGHLNPADFLTRGQTVQQLSENVWWWNAPDWLKDPERKWYQPANLERHSEEELNNERRKIYGDVLELTCSTQIREAVLYLSNYSSLIRVIRITAWIKRFCKNSKKPDEKQTGPLETEELKEAEIYWVSVAQQQEFFEEIEDLKAKKSVDKFSKLKDLNPFLDEHGLICLKSRLQNSDWTQREREPWILPYDSILSKLIVRRCHEEVMHSGVADTLAQIRETFWILNGRRLVKQVISDCLICKRLKARPTTQVTAPLPKDRITASPPFETSGVDFAGPLFVKNAKTSEKTYVVLFTCAVTRAVHLELVPDLSTPTFLLAFRRFVARRGICKTLYSDNAKTFKRAQRDLQQLWSKLDRVEMQNFFGRIGVQWKFITERAPWHGGMWERLVRSVKTCLKKTLGKTSLTFHEMTTTLTEVEAVLNSRPLTYCYTDANEPLPLTPSHFLVGHRLTSLPPGKPDPNIKLPKPIRTELTNKLKYRETLLDHFWKRWKREYLLDLRSAHLCSAGPSTIDLQVGDIVLIQQDKCPRHMWPMGRVITPFQGRDGKVRSCLIKTTSGTCIRRPVQLLYPLEIT